MNKKNKGKYLELYEKYGKIEIKCQGASELPLDAITDFQGKLKKRTNENKIKLATLIFSKGFIAPFFIWDNKGNYYNLDGHGRSDVLCEIRESGIPIPAMYPVAYIEADNEKDAREKLLAITSQFGEFDEAELSEWLKDIDKEIADTLRFVDEEICIIDEDIKIINNNDLEKSNTDHFYSGNSLPLRIGDFVAYISEEKYCEKIKQFTDSLNCKEGNQKLLNEIGNKIMEKIINENFFCK